MPVTLVESIERFDDLRDAWTALWDRSPTGHLFDTHDWLAAWWRAFAEPEDRLRVYGLREDGRLVAALPAMLRGRTLRLIFNHYLGRSELLAEHGRDDAYRALFGAVHDDRALWDVFELPQIPEDSPTVAALSSGAADPLGVHAVRVIASPFLQLEGTYDAWYEARFSSKKRQQDRRKYRQAEKIGPTTLVTHTAVEDVVAAFERGLEVEDKSWKGEEDSAIVRDPATLAFMRDVVRRFAERGAARLVEQTIDGRAAAFLLGFVAGDTFYFHKTGYDPAFGKASPGRTVLLAAIQLAFAEGLARFDFLGADDPYKLECSPAVRPHVTVFLHHGGARSRLLRQKKRWTPTIQRARGQAVPFEVRFDRGIGNRR